MNATPLLQFSGNEVYGATPNGLTLWWIGAFDDTGGPRGHVEDLQVWNLFQMGLLRYETNQLTIDGFVARGDPKSRRVYPEESGSRTICSGV